jgi:surface antigen
MKTHSLIAVLAATSLLTACAEPGGRGVTQGGSGVNKQEIGTLAGAIGGGILGSNIGGGKGAIAGTIAGTLLGGALGNSIGSSLDNADRAAYNDASQRALETAQPGQSLPWKNTQSGNYGSITPSGYYKDSQGRYCREYTQKIIVGGKTQEGHGTACREPDGTWKIIE